FDLAGTGDHGAVAIARAALDQALLQFVLVLRGIAVVDRLAHARLRVAAREDRHVESQAVGRRPAFTVGMEGVIETGSAVVGPARRFRVEDLPADRRQMRRTRGLYVGIGGVDLERIGTENRTL